MKRIFAIATALLTCLPLAIFAASFDCRKAATETEKMICKEPALSALDEDLARVYQQALAKPTDKELVRHWQRQWLNLREACGSIDCMRVAYAAQISDLKERAQRTATTNVSGVYQRYYKGRPDKDSSRLIVIELNDDRVRIFGTAVWVGNAATGAVNVGEVNAIGRVKSKQIAFTDTENEECKFMISVVDTSLKVGDDDGKCGGHNVTFTGEYRKLGHGK
jgi:uncharacterized protein YecT (DUF1311 family)